MLLYTRNISDHPKFDLSDQSPPVYRKGAPQTKENLLYERKGKILSSKSAMYVKRLLFEEGQNGQTLRNTILDPQAHLDEVGNPILEWPVFVGANGEPIVLYLKSSLGKGAHGEVYLGVDMYTGEAVAVKMQETEKKHAKAEIIRENETLNNLGNLITNLELVKDNLYVNFSTQVLLWGENLVDLTEGVGFKEMVSVEAFTNIALSLIDDLEHLNKLYCHRDIKPDNVIYDKKTGKAKLADMGSCIPNNTTQGIKMFSPFAPMEVLASFKAKHKFPYTSKVDIHGLGLTLGYLFSKTSMDSLNNGDACSARTLMNDIFSNMERFENDPLKRFAQMLCIIMTDDDPDARPEHDWIKTQLYILNTQIKNRNETDEENVLSNEFVKTLRDLENRAGRVTYDEVSHADLGYVESDNLDGYNYMMQSDDTTKDISPNDLETATAAKDAYQSLMNSKIDPSAVEEVLYKLSYLDSNEASNPKTRFFKNEAIQNAFIKDLSQAFRNLLRTPTYDQLFKVCDEIIREVFEDFCITLERDNLLEDKADNKIDTLILSFLNEVLENDVQPKLAATQAVAPSFR